METLEEYLNNRSQMKKINMKSQEIDVQDTIYEITNNPNLVLNKLKDIDNMSEQDIYKVITDHFDLIMDNIYNTTSPTNCLSLFTNNKFLLIFTQVLPQRLVYNGNNIKYIITINRVIYDYIHHDSNMDEYKKGLIFNLARVNNKLFLNSLLAIGLTEDIAVNLCMNRYSSDDMYIPVKRLNKMLLMYPSKLMTEQLIVYIYERLFTRITPLLIGTMFDNDLHFYHHHLSDEGREICDRESLAVLDLLENMPLNSIRDVLTSYSQFYVETANNLLASGRNVDNITRFSLKAINIVDYPRILNSIDIVEKQGYIIK